MFNFVLVLWKLLCVACCVCFCIFIYFLFGFWYHAGFKGCGRGFIVVLILTLDLCCWVGFTGLVYLDDR